MTYTSTAQGAYFVGMADLGASNNYLRPMTIAQAQAALGFSNSFGSNGWQKLPGGLILQWGTVAASGPAFRAITFPLAFPAAVYCIMISDRSPDTNGGIVDQTSIYTNYKTSGFSVSQVGTSAGIFWTAIGR
jgi:hypothetical protein